MVTIRRCTNFAEVEPLLVEYERSLIHELPPQEFDRSMVDIARHYEVIFLADCDGRIGGCAALHKLDTDIAEMKRLYVTPDSRGSGAGKALANAVIDEAKKRGYKRLRLDTLPSMRSAQHLYESLGFRDIDRYHDDPGPRRFMEKEL